MRRLPTPAHTLQRVANLYRSADTAASATVYDRMRPARGNEERLPAMLKAREKRRREGRSACRYMRRGQGRYMRIRLHAEK